jgi:single-strand DNA-binding protein
MNTVHLIGRLGRDPESRESSGGTPVVNCTIAVGKRIKGGEEQTTWVRLVFWDKLAAIVEQYCSKGSQIAIVGELQVREFVKDGNRQTSTEVRVHSLDLLGGKPERSEGSEPRYPANGDKRSSRSREPGENDNREDFDDELPF